MSAFFGARAPELEPEVVRDLNVKPASSRKQPLHERSLSDLNRSNNGKPTIRLIDSDQDSDTYKKSPFPSSPAHVLRPPMDPSRKQKEPIYIDVPSANARPRSREGPSGPRSYHAGRTSRISVSTTTSNADTLVADSLFSPTSRRFSVESASNKPHYSVETPGLGPHLEPLEELSSDRPDTDSSSMPDIPELPSSIASRSRQLAHSSSIYSSGPALEEYETPRWQRPRSSSSGVGFAVSPMSEEDEEEEVSSNSGGPREPAPKPSQGSMAESQRTGSTQERGTPHIIRYMSSDDSLQPQFASIRPAPHHSRSASSLWSWASVQDQNVEPLQVPRKRAHRHSASLTTYPSLTRMGASHLSTIASEAEVPESSRMSQQSPAMGGQTWPRRRKTIASSTYSESVATPQLEQGVKNSSSYDTMSTGLHSDGAVPEPLFSSSAPLPQQPFDPNMTYPTDEVDDTIGELQQPPPLREMRSGYFIRKRSHTDLRPSSRQSNHNTIESERWSTGSFIFPQWAKYFYAGNVPILSAKPSKATLADHFASNNASRVTIAGPPYNTIETTMTRSLDLPRPPSRGKRHSRTGTEHSIASRPSSAASNWETIYTGSPASKFVNVFRGNRRPRSPTDPTSITTRRRHDSVSVVSALDEDEILPVPKPPTKSSLRALRHPLRQNPRPGPGRKPSTVRTFRTQSSRNGSNIAHPATSRNVSGANGHVQPAYPQSFPHLIPNARLARSLTTAWRVPSIDEPFPAEIFGRGNRQIVCFCLGFLFPPLWILAAFLALPKCGWREETEGGAQGRIDEKGGEERLAQEVGTEEQWSWDDERRFLKARWWRNLNRVMSVVGMGILGAIIALAVLASRG